MNEKYQKIIYEQQHFLDKLTPISAWIGNIKLVLAVGIAILLYQYFSNAFSAIFLLSLAVFVIAFLSLALYHIRLHEKMDFSTGLIHLNQRHLQRISGQWIEFEDIGKEFMNKEHPYANDLDIVGRSSLFQYLNTTNTWHGRKIFASSLMNADFSKEEILLRQEAIQELSQDLKLSNQIEYFTSKIGTDASIKTLTDNLKDNQLFFKNTFFKYLLMCLPIFTILTGAAMLLFKLRPLFLPTGLLILLQTFLWGIGIGRIRNYLDAVSQLPFRLSAYAATMEIIANSSFSSAKLKEIQKLLASSVDQIKNLGKIAEKINLKHSALLYLPLNILLLWDYECIILLEKWKQKNAVDTEMWFLALGEFESLLSFSHLPNLSSHTCLPQLSASKNNIEAEAIGHPLLSGEHRVNNNFSCYNEIFIISGSNMSGKTTFLRTIGINLILAKAGSFVCASKMTFSLVQIMTSMRISDDLNEGVSTFYAELKRIRNIIAYAREHSELFFLIDEIFRGTNSVDRLSGAKAVLTRLYECKTAGMISTHDLELCNLSDHDARIKNLNFSEYYKDNKIFFDYKLRNGRSKTTNAEFLMKMAGII